MKETGVEWPVAGSLRITNPETLEKWKQNGQFQALIDNGWFFGEGCGRFRDEPCKCYKCRKLKNK